MSLRSSRFRVLNVIPKKQAQNRGIPLMVPTSVTTAFTTGVVMIWNFSAHKWWTFGEKPQAGV